MCQQKKWYMKETGSHIQFINDAGRSAIINRNDLIKVREVFLERCFLRIRPTYNTAT